ncbi:chaperone protein DnaJ-like [Lolium rigidum]|uniref:chaperone protein DnaJ-like n=1 Tax=Lolium rigidum TaxID=89674 RepID=UPI001F5C8E33|nr:chaperone protein DnaJ-like [Lolium rigidum]
MSAGGSGIRHDADVDLYGVLGLKKECSDADLRIAYRRLAMTWHPDRCSASGSSASVEEAKERFQEIQGAYSVLSDSGKRLLYDVGVNDSDGNDDDYDNHHEQDVSGMDDFFGEMAEMMNQTTPTESFEELQQLFVDMFQADLVGVFGFGGPPPMVHRAQAQSPPCTSGSSSPSCNGVNKRSSPAIGSRTPPRPGRSGSASGLSGSSSKGSDLRRHEDAPWMREDTSAGGMNKKQRMSTRQSHGVSSSEGPG